MLSFYASSPLSNETQKRRLRLRVFSASLYGSRRSFLRVVVVLLEDEGEVVEAGERHDDRVHDGVEVVNVHGSNGVLIAAATQSEELEEDTLLVLLAISNDANNGRRTGGKRRS